MTSQPIKYSVGIDVSAKSLAVCVLRYHLLNQTVERLGRKSFSNTGKGLSALLEWVKDKLGDSRSVVFAMEATGVYHENAAYQLSQAGYSVAVVLPNMIKAYGRSYNRAGKTDLIDSELIATYAAERDVTIWVPATPEQMKIRRLTRQRAGFVRQRTQLKNALHAAESAARPDRFVIANYRKMVRHFDKSIKTISERVEQLIRQDEYYASTAKRMRTVPGIGPLTAATLLAETDGFKLFTKRSQLVKFAGLDVVANQSGSSINGPGHISRTGNGRLRGALHMAAWTAVRKEGPLKSYYERVLERVRIPNKALVAVQRKLLLITYACVKNKEDYDSQRHQKDVVGTKADHGAYTTQGAVLLES